MLEGRTNCVNWRFWDCSLSGTAAQHPCCPQAGPVLKCHAMSFAADAARDQRAALFRKIPSVDELLGLPVLAELASRVNRDLVLDTARDFLERVRDEITRGSVNGPPEPQAIAAQIAGEVARLLKPSLGAVINATGVILHTNLGRAPIAETAIEHIRETAGQYTNLEYDVSEGKRGRRDAHTSRLLTRLTGAEAACVVNNNAAAIFLALASLARGGEVIVSRGELIEIGESFRIPEIMAESGAILREVGTTNRTSLADYEHAINDQTRLLLRVHRSNFAIVGFTARPALGELVELSRRARIPLYEDLGSGCLVDLGPQGVAEPVVRESIEAGVDLVSFSGDKLMGGPQAGTLAGRRELVARARKHPLFRALRLDKLVIAALEATLLAYLRNDLDALPAMRMIRASADEIGRRAQKIAQDLEPVLSSTQSEIEIADGQSVIGGGSTPAEYLPTRLLRISSAKYSATQLETRLRNGGSSASSNLPPVLARVSEDCLVLDLRTVFASQEQALIASLTAALR
jgi:L-seryl-tRNA(Ser) seleniumtransferase